MPTLQETFVDLVASVIRLGTKPCHCTKETPGKCWGCKGTGEAKLHPLVSALAAFGEDAPKAEPCDKCDGKGICTGCEGTREAVPHEYSELIIAGVNTSTMIPLEGFRRAGEWDRFHELFDYLYAWNMKGIQVSMAENPPNAEELARIRDCLEAPKPSDRKPAPLTFSKASALTPEELEELGIE